MNKSIDEQNEKESLIIKSVKPKDIKLGAHALNEPKRRVVKLAGIEVTYDEAKGTKKRTFLIDGELCLHKKYYFITKDDQNLMVYDPNGKKIGEIRHQALELIVCCNVDNIVFKLQGGEYHKYYITGELIDSNYNPWCI